MLDTARDTSLLFQFASVLACGHAPPTAVEAIRMGRITALRKPTGGVRGIIVGDVLEDWSNNGQTDGSEGGSNHGTIPARHHQSWVRECGADPSEHDGPR